MRIDPSTARPRPTYCLISPVLPTWRPHDGCGLLPHIVWTFRRFVSLQSAGRRFPVPPSGTTCLSKSHLRHHSRFSDNDSRPFCFPVPTKTLSYDPCVTITIHHYCLGHLWTVLAIISIIQATLKMFIMMMIALFTLVFPVILLILILVSVFCVWRARCSFKEMNLFHSVLLFCFYLFSC